jgi:hypothetical protein
MLKLLLLTYFMSNLNVGSAGEPVLTAWLNSTGMYTQGCFE